VAAKLAAQELQYDMNRISLLRDYLEREILRFVPTAIRVGDSRNRLPNTLNVAFENIEADSILLMLNREINCCILRIGLHIRLAQSIPCVDRHEDSVQSSARIGALLAFARELRLRRGSGYRSPSASIKRPANWFCSYGGCVCLICLAL